MEEAACRLSNVGDGVHSGTRTRLAAGVRANRVATGELANGLDAFGENVCVAWVGEETVVDRERCARVG